MYIKRSYLAGLAVVGAGFLGWFLHSSTAATQAAPAAAHAAPAAAAIAPIADTVDPEAGPSTGHADQPPIVLSLTINDGPSDETVETAVVDTALVGRTPPAASEPAPRPDRGRILR